MLFHSLHPDIDSKCLAITYSMLSCTDHCVVPLNKPIWSWLFNREASEGNEDSVNGFQDAANGDFISYRELRTLSSKISTSFTRDYGFKAGDCISVFCANSIWYPVAMYAALRVGELMKIHDCIYSNEL
jgi:hypothetical protein